MHPLLVQRLTVLRRLTIDGPNQIREVGRSIINLINNLEDLNLIEPAHSTIQAYKNNFRDGKRQFNEYMRNCNEVLSTDDSIQNKVTQLANPFEKLRESMDKFYDSLYEFITTDLGLRIEDGHVVFSQVDKAIEVDQNSEVDQGSEVSEESILTHLSENSENSQASENSHVAEVDQVSEESILTHVSENSENSQASENSHVAEVDQVSEESILTHVSENSENSQASENSHVAEVDQVKKASELTQQKKEIQSTETQNANSLANNKLICELTIPFKTVLPISSYEVSIFSNGFFSISPQFQLQYLTTENNCNTLFFGVKCDIRLNLSNRSKLHHENSHVVSARIFNTTGKIYRTPERSETTLSVGQIWEVQNTEIGTFINVEVGQMRNTSFQFDWSTSSAIAVFDKTLYLTCKPSIAYEVFPFTQKMNELVENSHNGTIDQSLNNLMDISESAHISESTIKSGNVQFDYTPSIQWVTHDYIKVNQSPKIRGEVGIDPTLPSMSQTHTNVFYKTGLSGIIALILGIFIYRNKNTIKKIFHSLTKIKKDD